MEKKVIFSQRVIRCSFSRCLFWQRDSRREMLITKRFPRNARHITLFTQRSSRNAFHAMLLTQHIETFF